MWPYLSLHAAYLKPGSATSGEEAKVVKVATWPADHLIHSCVLCIPSPGWRWWFPGYLPACGGSAWPSSLPCTALLAGDLELLVDDQRLDLFASRELVHLQPVVGGPEQVINLVAGFSISPVAPSVERHISPACRQAEVGWVVCRLGRSKCVVCVLGLAREQGSEQPGPAMLILIFMPHGLLEGGEEFLDVIIGFHSRKEALRIPGGIRDGDDCCGDTVHSAQ